MNSRAKRKKEKRKMEQIIGTTQDFYFRLLRRYAILFHVKGTHYHVIFVTT